MPNATDPVSKVFESVAQAQKTIAHHLDIIEGRIKAGTATECDQRIIRVLKDINESLR